MNTILIQNWSLFFWCLWWPCLYCHLHTMLQKWFSLSCTMRVIRGIAIAKSFPESCISPFSLLSCYVMRQLSTNLQVSALTSELLKGCVKINSSDTRKSKNPDGFHIYYKYRFPYFWRSKILMPPFSFICVRGKISQIWLVETKSQLKDLSCLPSPLYFLFITTWNIGGAGSEVLSHHLNNIPISCLYK